MDEELEAVEGEEHCEDELVRALTSLRGVNKTEFVELVRASSSSSQVRLLIRIHDIDAWLQTLVMIYKEEKRARGRWKLHICKLYMYDDETEKLKYIWNFTLSSQHLSSATDDLCRLFDMVANHYVWVRHDPTPPPPVKLGPVPDTEIFQKNKREGVFEDGEIVSFPLLGRSGRNIPEGGLFEKGKSPKGAHPVKIS